MCENTEHISTLFQTILSLKTQEEVEDFFSDLCTPSEISAMAERLYGAKLLMDGNTYEQVIKQTKLSSTTLSRISKSIKNGNGYKKVIKK